MNHLSPSAVPRQNYTVLPLQPSHLSGVAMLETLCFPEEPWSEQSLHALCREHGTGFVAVESDGTISAYVGMLYAAGEGNITNVATHPDYRRGGRAESVLRALLCAAKTTCPEGIFLEVRPSNTAALQLYGHMGFEICGKRKNFYRHPTEDALLMRILP